MELAELTCEAGWLLVGTDCYNIAISIFIVGFIPLLLGGFLGFGTKILLDNRSRKFDKKDRENRERVEDLTKGIDNPEAIKRAAAIPGLLKFERAEGSSELGPGPRTWLLYLLLIIMVGIVVGVIVVIR